MKKRIILILAIVGTLFLGGCSESPEYEYSIDYISFRGATGTISCSSSYSPYIRERDSVFDGRQRGSLICGGTPVALDIQSISYIKTE